MGSKKFLSSIPTAPPSEKSLGRDQVLHVPGSIVSRARPFLFVEAEKSLVRETTSSSGPLQGLAVMLQQVPPKLVPPDHPWQLQLVPPDHLQHCTEMVPSDQRWRHGWSPFAIVGPP